MNFCPNCGNSIGANDKFCPVCGEKLQNNQPGDQPDDQPGDQPGEVEVKPVSSNEPHQYQYQASGVDTREKKKEKDNGTISLVCGSIALGSIIFSWIPFVGIIGFVLSIVSIVFGNKAKDTSYGKTGRILGIIALVIQIVEFVIGIVVFCLFVSGTIKSGGYNTYISLFNLIGGLR